MQAFIAYYRESTRGQEISGLGFEAQLESVTRHVVGAHGTVLASYKETESGKRKDRPQLLLALAHAKRSRAILVVAKLDRLARNVAFLSALMEAGVDFVCCDNPHANRLMLHMMVAFAEEEARQISARTKAALAAFKARGGKLGSLRPAGLTKKKGWQPAAKSIARIEGAHQSGQVIGCRANALKARQAYTDIAPIMRSLRNEGSTLRQIADRLNAIGQTTRNQKPWNAVQVMRVLAHA